MFFPSLARGMAGLISVKITNRPDNPSYMFAKDAYGESYFLHSEYLKNGTWEDWLKIHVGQILNILSDTEKEPNKSSSASEIYISPQ